MKWNASIFVPNLKKISPAARTGLFWLVVAMLLPVSFAYYQTLTTGHSAVQREADRVVHFFLNEAERALSETERLMDSYLHATDGSCRTRDMIPLKKFVASRNATIAMGVVSPDGKVACTTGNLDLHGLSFPVRDENTEKQAVASFAELKIQSKFLPVLITRGRSGTRLFAVMSTDRFTNILLPQFIIDYAQIDVVMPRGGVWYTLTGNALSSGFSEKTTIVRQSSDRYPISVQLVLDSVAGTHWGGALRSSLILITGLCIGFLVSMWASIWGISAYQRRLRRKYRQRIAANARDMMKLHYQPIMDLKSNLLVGTVVTFDMSLFDTVPEHKPKPAEILSNVWRDLRQFASKRRLFYILIEFDGEDVINDAHREELVRVLQEINYPNLLIMLRWPENKGTDPSTYKYLEEVSNAGCMLGLECTEVRFSLLSDMWTWPYHRLVVDVEKIPRLEEAVIWTSEIVVELAEQLQVGTLAVGLYDRFAVDLAIGSGFDMGVGNELGPPLPIDVFLSVVRPVGGFSLKVDEAETKAA